MVEDQPDVKRSRGQHGYDHRGGECCGAGVGHDGGEHAHLHQSHEDGNDDAPAYGRRGGTENETWDTGDLAAITYEAGEPMRFKVEDVERGVEGIRYLMRARGMVDQGWLQPEPEVFRRSMWVRCDDGGILITDVELGERVKMGQVLGTVTDPLSNERVPLVSPHAGVVIGMALNQVVMPGFAAFHLGIEEPQAVAPPGEDEDWTVEAVEENVREADELPE